MIPVKIISKEQSVKLGIVENNQEEVKGGGVVAVSVVGKKEEDGSVTEVERINIKANGDKELIFMTEERRADLDSRGGFLKYLNQFKKIAGMEKESFLREIPLKDIGSK